MTNLLKIIFCLIVIYNLVDCRIYPVAEDEDLKTWYFRKTDSDDNKIKCLGPHCDQVNITVVKCQAVYFEVSYECNTPDITEKDPYHADYKIQCENDVYKHENCHVEVYVTKKNENDNDKPDNGKDKKRPSLLQIILFLIIGQLLILLVFVPLAICLFRLLKNRKPQ